MAGRRRVYQRIVKPKPAVLRVSSFYGLPSTQAELEFIDVDLNGDTRLFVDPHSLWYIDSDWARECLSLVQDLFTEVLAATRLGDRQRADYLLGRLSEPNETHLGLSAAESRGSGVGDGLARDIWAALSTSRALQGGLLADLEDTVLFVDGIGLDRISDITTNVIRAQLVKFTQDACQYYGIPLTPGIASGPCWNRSDHRWYETFAELPIANGARLLLVPKSIVRQGGIFSPGEYFTHYVQTYQQADELRRRGHLVRFRKDGTPFVTKKSLRLRDPRPSKHVNLAVTLANPGLLDQYREAKRRPDGPPTHEQIAAATETPVVDWDQLLGAVVAVPPGREHADDYHRAIQSLLTPLLYPSLDMPIREFKIHEGRKRIDINYTNVATSGFFRWLVDFARVPASQLVVECKNYSKELKNPEIDQLAGRFSPVRGKVGFLCHRGYNDKAELVRRCRDAALDDRGFVIPLDDTDLMALVEARKEGDDLFELLMRRFQELA